MESYEDDCTECQSIQKHTIRFYITKNKSYSVITTSTDKSITTTCHGCLLEQSVSEDEQRRLIAKYETQLLAQEGYELYEAGKYKDSVKRYNKALKKDSSYSQAMYGKAQSLIAWGNYGNARPLVDELTKKFPDSHEVQELESILKQNYS